MSICSDTLYQSEVWQTLYQTKRDQPWKFAPRIFLNCAIKCQNVWNLSRA